MVGNSEQGGGQEGGGADPSLSRDELHGQTARASWSELERFFAGGKLLNVALGHNLVAVAEAIAGDDAATVQNWLETGILASVSDEQAAQWQSADESLWAVVVAPWILVQTVALRDGDPDD